MKKIAEVYIGVDISKNNLDIYIYPIKKSFRIANSEIAIKKFIKELVQYDVVQIGCEATGGYEKLLAQLLKKSNYVLWIIDPRRIRVFIIATGCKSKTDKIDAQKIAEFVSKNSPDYMIINKNESQEKLQALINRKNDLIKTLASEKTRLHHPSHQFCVKSIKRFIKVLEKEIRLIEDAMKILIQEDEELDEKATILESIPGIGKASAATLLAFIPELGQINNKKIAALVGLCPYDNASGNYNGKKNIKGGRIIPRNMLYMCALTTIKYHLPLKTFYNRLIAQKPFKVAIVAVMHKLIVIANSLLKKKELCV